MPQYNYYCKTCGKVKETFESMNGTHQKSTCECGQTAIRIWDTPTLITDTSFCMTGRRDRRFVEAGNKEGVMIEGRKHWNKLVKEKGYTELSDSQFKND